MITKIIKLVRYALYQAACQEDKLGKKLRTPLIYLAIVVLMIVLLTQLQNGGTDDKKIEYADFLAMAKEGTVEAVEYCNGEIVGIKALRIRICSPRSMTLSATYPTKMRSDRIWRP
jgi:hypothetical protein